MERHIFIHGSAGGQSAFSLPDAPKGLCDQLANEYFKGRIMRQKKSAGKFTMFVELCETNGDRYYVYSFLNNECLGPHGTREGNYFAITILCKEFYVYPEVIYQMLSRAYNDMLKQKHIIHVNRNGKDEFVISQFSEAQDYLTQFLKKIEGVFDVSTGGAGISFKGDIKVADYDSWSGEKVNVENCNSMDTFDKLCATGRLYISENYESNKARLTSLQTRVSNLENENKQLKQQQAQANQKKNASINKEITTLNEQIREKDAEIKRLSEMNDEYSSKIDLVLNELGKYAKAGEKLTGLETSTKKSSKKDKHDLLKTILLVTVLILTIISCLLNYLFFRDLSLASEKKKDTSEMTTNEKEGATEEEAETDTTNNTTCKFEINQQNIEAEATGIDCNITITSDKEWECPTSNFNWVTLKRIDNATLNIKVNPQTAADERTATFMVKSGENEKQITIRQKGKIVQQEEPVKYNIEVKDAGGHILKNGDSVSIKQRLTATVKNPKNIEKDYGWRYVNCTGNDKSKNVASVNITVGSAENKKVIISYGYLKDDKKRTNIIFNIKKEDKSQTEVQTAPQAEETEVQEKVDKGTEAETTTPDSNVNS